MSNKILLKPINNYSINYFYNNYIVFDQKSKGYGYNYENLFIEIIEKFINKYPLELLNIKNINNFKEDGYWFFSYFYKLYFIENDMEDDETLNEEEIKKYEEIKQNTKIIIENIRNIKLKNNYCDPVILPLKNVINFLKESKQNMEKINSIIENNQISLENCKKDLETNIKIQEITKYVENDSIDTNKIDEYIFCLNKYLKDYEYNCEDKKYKKKIIIESIRNLIKILESKK